MVHVFIRHKVKDYGTWRQVFDGFAAKRREGGEVAFKIAAVSGEPNNLCFFFEWQGVAKAKELLGSADLAREMERRNEDLGSTQSRLLGLPLTN